MGRANRDIDKDYGNNLFPVFLKLEHMHLLIVGGGVIGLEKINAVIKNSPETKITLVAKVISAEIKSLVKSSGNIELVEKPFEIADLENKDLVIAATGDRAVSELIRTEASKRKILVNVADTPDLCDFYLGSIVRKGDLKIAISTNGKSPTLAKRLKEVFNEALPDDTQITIDSLNKFRNQLKGDFTEKVKKLNEATAILTNSQNISSLQPHLVVKKKKTKKELIRYWSLYSLASIALMVLGHLLFTYVPFSAIGGYAGELFGSIDETVLIFIAAGFVAQMVDGSLGMAYGLSATTFLLSFGVTPAAASASVHASEIFTTGASGLSHLKFKNVNTKLFKNLLIPGIIGAIIGAYILSSAESYSGYIKPVVSVYTLILGITIIIKAIRKLNEKKKIKRIGILAFFGAFLDSIGGGGWGP
ncbi:MAG: TSUP family transporter, partial [Bacteroidia bacterium]|nr:TSUP family transporter [Bacteroidia bacterium]